MSPSKNSDTKNSDIDAAKSVAQDVRITSLDQFRGYSVAAMFVVNFVQHMVVAHQTLKHNNTHFSYADSIMPSFILACGMAYRMSFAKLVVNDADASAWRLLRRRILIRSLALILLCVMFFGLGGSIGKWSDMSPSNVAKFIADLLKANMWEVLAIIGACQIFILPLMATSTKIRIAAFCLLSLLHVMISWSFNYDFVYGKPNWMDAYFGGAGKRAWDGGFFGIIAWSQIMLVGTIAYDLTQPATTRRGGSSVPNDLRRDSAWGSNSTIASLILLGTLLMILGYASSCLTRFYDTHELSAEQIQSLVRSPVLPNVDLLDDRPVTSLLAEAPFIPPPSVKDRIPNYWQMDKRVVSASFVFFGSGFALAVYGLFVLFCDTWKWNLGLLRTFGQNPLAAYLIHHLVAHTTLSVVPRDSSLAWVLVGLASSFGVTYLFVRYLEKRGLYLRL
jgi:predicted acyltransferase